MDEHEVPYEVDGQVRVAILTGAGRGFCAGLDIKDALAGTGIAGGSRLNTGAGAGAAGAGGVLRTRTIPTVVLHEMETPIIAAINGAAAGYGVELGLVNRVVPDSELLATAREWADDFAESLAAFAEGRSPDFRGR